MTDMSHELDNRMRTAAMSGDLETVRTLLDQGAEVESSGLGGYTAIMDAASSGHYEVVKLLIEHGAEISKKDGTYGDSLLSHAFSAEHFEIVKLLLDNGAQIEDELPQLVRHAMDKDKVWIIDSLIKLGIDLFCDRFSTDWSLLIQACHSGQFEIAKVLISAGAELDSRDDIMDLSPLGLAARCQHAELYQLLVDHGAQVDIISASHIGRFDLVKQCVSEGADINSTNTMECSPLVYATDGNHYQIVEYLLEQGADVHRTSRLSPALQRCKDSRMSELLEKHGFEGPS